MLCNTSYLIRYRTNKYVLPPSQIVSHSKNLGESKHFSCLTKLIEKNTKICNVKRVYYENIIKEESNDT